MPTRDLAEVGRGDLAGRGNAGLVRAEWSTCVLMDEMTLWRGPRRRRVAARGASSCTSSLSRPAHKGGAIRCAGSGWLFPRAGQIL